MNCYDFIFYPKSTTSYEVVDFDACMQYALHTAVVEREKVHELSIFMVSNSKNYTMVYIAMYIVHCTYY